MRLCLMIEGQEGVTWDDWVRLARLTEENGLEGLFSSDHYTAIIRPDADAHDAWATLAGLAAVTERIRLGTMVSPATFRHPSVLARMAVTVDHISGGRVEVGMGSGWYEREHEAHGFPFLDGRQRFELFAEQVEVVVRSWTEERFDHDGPAYRLRDQQALPRPRAAAAPAARPGRHGQAEVRRPGRALRHRGEHARRSRRGAPRAQGQARPCVRGGRARSGDARLLRDDGVLRGRDGGGRRRARRRGSVAIRGGDADAAPSSRSGATAGSSARSTRSSNASKAFARSVSRASFYST